MISFCNLGEFCFLFSDLEKSDFLIFFLFFISLKVEMVGTPKAFKFPPLRHDLCGFDKQPFLC